ncbi:hypothetical protein PTKIN_Ptkin04bG0227500 [Pterospermum kingtungense]
MAAELGLLSLNQLQKLAQSQQNQNHHHQYPNPNYLMWNPKAQPLEADDDDSWEVRAFAEDTGNAMGTTWPPRSYTCTFCRREFRSAQALGGHMNVHRRDRARLHQTHRAGAAALINPTSSSSATTAASTSTLLIPTQEFATNGRFCLLYQLPSPSTGVFTSPPMSACSYPSLSFPITPPGLYNSSPSSLCYSTKPATSTSPAVDNINDNSFKEASSTEELDLELRLGHRPTTS